MIENLFEIWKESVQNYKWWISAANRNFVVADLLYKNYLEASEEIEIKSNNFSGLTIPFEVQLLSTIHPNIIMQYGFGLECLIKAFIVKQNLVNVFDKKDQYKLSKPFTKHIGLLYDKYKNELPKISSKDPDFISKLNRGVYSGKFPFEKTPNFFSYTANLDETVSFAKNFKEKLLEKLH